MIKKLSIRQPDDWHVHFREDEMLRVITKYSSRINRRCIAMPNTTIPITTSTQAKNYKSCEAPIHKFQNRLANLIRIADNPPKKLESQNKSMHHNYTNRCSTELEVLEFGRATTWMQNSRKSDSYCRQSQKNIDGQ